LWLGEQVFADSRAAVYYHPDEDQNLLAQHLKVRDALKRRRERTGSASRKGNWRRVLDQYQVTHIVPRLSVVSALDYQTAIDLFEDDSGWELTSLGAVAAVFYRTDLDDDGLQAFIDKNRVDFRDRAYKHESELRGARDRWVRPPSFYQKYFWSKKRDIPAEVLEGTHLARLAAQRNLPRRYANARAAMANLAIRRAQAGLAKDPDSAEGYIVLGQAYSILADWESIVVLNGSRPPNAGLRYVQAVASYNQALVADPGNLDAHGALVDLYAAARKPELELVHLEAIDAAIGNDPDVADFEVINRLTSRLKLLRDDLKTTDEEVAPVVNSAEPVLRRIQPLMERGCIVRVLKLLDEELSQMSGNLIAEQLRIMLLLEAGRVEESGEAAERFSEPARSERLPNWEDTVALSKLPNADYNGAVSLWRDAAVEIENAALTAALLSLPARTANRLPWPISTTSAAFEYFYQRPEAVGVNKLNVALAYLEQGQLALAERYLRETLERSPETPNRALIVHYLHELTGRDDVDLYPPSETIPPLFAPEVEVDQAARVE
jgi:tetratricopeptide (TPR) repeat protein